MRNTQSGGAITEAQTLLGCSIIFDFKVYAHIDSIALLYLTVSVIKKKMYPDKSDLGSQFPAAGHHSRVVRVAGT